MPTFVPPPTDSTLAAKPALLNALPEPRAGGNYLRDPLTGALPLNPEFEIPQE